MENASKALLMAGSVLIALIVISLLVMSFTSLRSLRQTEEGLTREEQATQFNSQYEAYSRNLYGSEILSIVNKIDDYNKIEAENEGYTRIEIYINIKSDLNSNYFKKGTYTSTTLKNEIAKVETEAEKMGNKRITSKNLPIYSRSISQLANMRTAEIEYLGFETSQYQAEVAEYNTYKTLVTQIRARVFKFESFEYDKNTGRIIKMNYSL